MGKADDDYTPEQKAAIKKMVANYTPEERAAIQKKEKAAKEQRAKLAETRKAIGRYMDIYQVKDIFTPDGFLGYREDTSELIAFLEQRLRSTTAAKTKRATSRSK